MAIKPWGKYCIPLQKGTVSWRDTIEKRRHSSPGQKTLILDCSPSMLGLQSVYRRTRVRILKDWLKNAVLYIQEYGVKRERAKSVKPVVQFHILVELEIVLYTCLMQGIENYFLFGGRKERIAAATFKISRTSKLHNERRHKIAILLGEHLLLEIGKSLGIACRGGISVELAVLALGTMALKTHRTSLPPTRERQAGFVVCRIVCRTAIPDNTDICLRRGVFSKTPPSCLR